MISPPSAIVMAPRSDSYGIGFSLIIGVIAQFTSAYHRDSGGRKSTADFFERRNNCSLVHKHIDNLGRKTPNGRLLARARQRRLSGGAVSVEDDPIQRKISREALEMTH